MWILIVRKIFTMFLILFLGLLCYKKRLLDDQTTVKLSDFLLMVVNPLVIFVSYQINYEEALLMNLFTVMLFSVLSFVLQILLIRWLIPDRGNPDADIERLSAVYGNCGFIGIPLINGLFGREGVFYMTAYLTVFYAFFWTHGVIVMAGKTDVRSTLKNLLSPAIIGVALGLLCFLLRIRVPSDIVNAMDSVGSMNTPLAMLVAGASLGRSHIVECLQKRRIYWVSALKLIVVPAVCMLLLIPVRLPSTLAVTLLVATGCPVGACCAMFALKYKQDGQYASEIFAVSTLLSALTIPALIAVTELLGIL